MDRFDALAILLWLGATAAVLCFALAFLKAIDLSNLNVLCG